MILEGSVSAMIQRGTSSVPTKGRTAALNSMGRERTHTMTIERMFFPSAEEGPGWRFRNLADLHGLSIVSYEVVGGVNAENRESVVAGMLAELSHDVRALWPSVRAVVVCRDRHVRPQYRVSPPRSMRRYVPASLDTIIEQWVEHVEGSPPDGPTAMGAGALDWNAATLRSLAELLVKEKIDALYLVRGPEVASWEGLLEDVADGRLWSEGLELEPLRDPAVLGVTIAGMFDDNFEEVNVFCLEATALEFVEARPVQSPG